MPSPLAIKDHIRESNLFRQRLVVIVVAILLLSVLLLTRLLYLQVTSHHLYSTLSQKNQLDLLPLAPNRGLIFDRNDVLLAKNVSAYALMVTPFEVKDMPKTLAELQKIIPMSPTQLESFHQQLKQRRAYDAIPLKVKLSEQEVARFAVQQYRFPGVRIKATLIREYPQGKAFAHVLGYVGRINNSDMQQIDAANYSATDFIGKVGLEKYYEASLHGQVGYQQVETDASGRVVRILQKVPPIPGENLYLSIDSRVEIAAEKALGNQRGAVVAIEPSTGEVLALVSTPSYDPNKFVTGISQQAFAKLANSADQPLYNRAIRGQYPPGSTIKPFVGLAGLSTQAVALDTRIFDPGWFRLPHTKHIYHDWKHDGHGWVSLPRAITESCDTYFYQLANKLGIKRLDEVLLAFGFGKATAIDMGEELPGLVPTPTWKQKRMGTHWYTGDTLLTGIGQGYMLATPLQLAEATAALAMHGQRFQPHLLLKRQFSDGKTEQVAGKELDPVVLETPSAWQVIEDAMHAVLIDKHGTGFRFGQNTPYTAAAKTGTAQVFSDHAMKDSDLPARLRDHSLFIVYAPIKHPKIAVAVITENSNFAPVVARKVIDSYLVQKKTA